MKIFQNLWRDGRWSHELPRDLDGENTVCFVFFGPDLDPAAASRELATALPRAHRIGCSGAGEIADQALLDDTAVVTIVKFESCEVRSASETVDGANDSFAAGARLAGKLNDRELKAIYILSEGLKINGTELVRGIYSVLGREIVVAGGLAGDGSRFGKTTILIGDELASGLVGAVGFFGSDLRIETQTGAGWLPFGPRRRITKSQGNVLFELDDKPALALYREFLGPASGKLPSSALMFPLLLSPSSDERSRNTVRTVLAVDDATRSMTFAGDMPLGEDVRFMRANQRSLIEAADACASRCGDAIDLGQPALSLMVSCVGRRLVLGSSTEDEIEAVFARLPAGSMQTGFYSYGELAPGGGGFSDLHNQTISLTWIQERKAG